MCGFAGIFHLNTMTPVDPARLERMCDAIAHRGPDGAGLWTAPGVGLGHRRLSIIDIAGSPQPMAASDGRAMLVFNGEIYNYRALRQELRQEGMSFRTDGDSEVILAAWRRWGVECLHRLHGMFAFAIYDLDRREMFLARDRLGVKPLFLAELADGSMIFGSEMKALTAHPMLRREIDPLSIEDYLAWGYVPDHRSFLKGVSKLAAGHYLLLRPGGTARPECWWDVSFAERRQGREADLSAELADLLRDAVQSRMVADVPLGAFLSGGVDSSSVVALMAEAQAAPVKTCSIGFDVAAMDESSHARAVAARFGCDHTERMVSPDDIAATDALAAMFDEPFADPSALPTWRVCQLARESVTVALSGDGADEAFAGYRRHVFLHKENHLRQILPAPWRAGVFGTLGRIYPKADWAPRVLRARSTFLALATTSDRAYADAVGLTGPELRASLYTPDYLALRGDYRAEQPMLDVMAAAPARSGLDRAQYADMKFWLPGGILTKVDRTSMAVGLEAREPLLDHRLVEFAASLPEAMRIRQSQGKWLLKHTMRRYLPDNVLFRPKQGFSVPIVQWFRGPLAGEARAIATSSALAQTGWFKAERIKALAETHISGRANHARLLWQLLMLNKAMARLGWPGSSS